MTRGESAASHLRHALQLLEWHRYLVGGGDVEVSTADMGQERSVTPAELLEQARVRVSHALVEITRGEVS